MAKKGDIQKSRRDSQTGKFIPVKDADKPVKTEKFIDHKKNGGDTESTGPKKK